LSITSLIFRRPEEKSSAVKRKEAKRKVKRKVEVL